MTDDRTTDDVVIEHHDVIVVGARCAGSPLATRLASAGLDVVVVDRATFPSSTPSTHMIQAEGMAVLDRLGVLDDVLATGAPVCRQAFAQVGRQRALVSGRSDGKREGACICVRRTTLDEILVEAAWRAGADVRTGTKVVEVVEEGGRVVGIRTELVAGGAIRELRAPVVVGADGTASFVARAVGARKYHTTPNERFAVWAYYEGAEQEGGPTITFQRYRREFIITCPSDGGTHTVAMMIDRDRIDEYRADPEGVFDGIIETCPEVHRMLRGATRIQPLQTMYRFTGYCRESAGPGWVLLGDAGQFKDPSPGQGISDALRQSERLADGIVRGLAPGGHLDDELAAFWAWRDEDAVEKHFWSADLGAAGRVSPVAEEVIAGLQRRPNGMADFTDIFHHRRRPSEVLTPARLLAASARLLVRGDVPRSKVVAETKRMIAADRANKRLIAHPVLEPAEPRPAIPVAVVADERVAEPVG